MDELTAIFAGIGLAAACGFRVFVPLFIASLGANLGVEAVGGVNFQDMLGAEFEWLGSTPITIALGVATVCEIGGYYIPWIDNALDAIATPAAVLAGIFISGAMLPEFIGDDSLKWIVATVAGGGSAGVVQGASVLARGTSSATTGGMGNPAVSSVELGGSVMTAGLVVWVPMLAGILVCVLLFFFIRTLFRFFKNRTQSKAEPAQNGEIASSGANATSDESS